MTAGPGRNMFDDYADNLKKMADGIRDLPPTPEKQTKRTLRSRRIDGVLFIRADDLADVLEAQLPAATAKLVATLRGSVAP